MNLCIVELRCRREGAPAPTMDAPPLACSGDNCIEGEFHLLSLSFVSLGSKWKSPQWATGSK